MTGRETLNRLMQVRRACTCPVPGDEREAVLTFMRKDAEKTAYACLEAWPDGTIGATYQAVFASQTGAALDLWAEGAR